MAGPDVLCIEERLEQVTVGPINFEVDEVFDEDTEQAVRWFQEFHELVVDGIVGPQTAQTLGIWPS
jgi:peptidoglycan hydrolase-like protein with peptidoglycan-binding domain